MMDVAVADEIEVDHPILQKYYSYPAAVAVVRMWNISDRLEILQWLMPMIDMYYCWTMRY